MATYKMDGAKFVSIEELKETFWEIYKEKMTPEEFEKYVQDNVETIE